MQIALSKQAAVNDWLVSVENFYSISYLNMIMNARFKKSQQNEILLEMHRG